MRYAPFIQNWFHGCGIQLEHLGGRLLGILGLDYSGAICPPFWKGRQGFVDDQLLSECMEHIEQETP